jgi:copper chaperone CopZ
MVFKDFSNVLLGHQYEIVFSKDQESTQRLVGSVVRIENIDPQTIEVGDHVLVYGLYENNYYWEVTVVDINFANQTVDATYDDVIRNTYTYDEIEGLISQEANLMGIFYYTASTPR